MGGEPGLGWVLHPFALEAFMELKRGDLRVWHCINPPGDPFHFPVKDVEEAKVVLKALADYDNFLGDHHRIFSNIDGLEHYDGGQWNEWSNEEGEDINDVIRREESDPDSDVR